MISPAQEPISQRAQRHADEGNWDAARTEWLHALTLAPACADLMPEISYLESLEGNFLLARDWALRAASTGSRTGEVEPALLNRLRTFNEIPLGRDLVLQLLADDDTPAPVLMDCAKQLSSLNDFKLVLQCAQAAV